MAQKGLVNMGLAENS